MATAGFLVPTGRPVLLDLGRQDEHVLVHERDPETVGVDRPENCLYLTHEPPFPRLGQSRAYRKCLPQQMPSAALPPRRAAQPDLLGPTRSTVIRSRTRFSSLHGLSVFVPVGVLSGDRAVVLDETVHGVWQGDHLDRSFGLEPPAEEPVLEDAEPGLRPPPQVEGLHGGLAGADDDPSVGVDGRRHRGELNTTVTSSGGEHRPMVVAHERERLLGVHGPKAIGAGRLSLRPRAL